MNKYLCMLCLLFSTPAVSAVNMIPPSSPSQEEAIISSIAEKFAKDVSFSHQHAIRSLGRESVISYHGCIMSCVNTNVHGHLLSQVFCYRVCDMSLEDGAMRDAVYYEDTNHIFPSRTNKQLKKIIRENMEYMFRADPSNVQVIENAHYNAKTGEISYHINTRDVKKMSLH